jgi:hypothetical protein
MRVSGFETADLEWTDAQRDWLDQLCAEARLAARVVGGARPAVGYPGADVDRGGNT